MRPRALFSSCAAAAPTAAASSSAVMQISPPKTDTMTDGYTLRAARRSVERGQVPTMKILFLHGWQSVPGGVKPTYLRDHGHEVINPKLSDEDFNEAVRIAQAEFDQHQPQVVVGSSRGGTIAMNIKSGAAKLVLLIAI